MLKRIKNLFKSKRGNSLGELENRMERLSSSLAELSGKMSSIEKETERIHEKINQLEEHTELKDILMLDVVEE